MAAIESSARGGVRGGDVNAAEVRGVRESDVAADVLGVCLTEVASRAVGGGSAGCSACSSACLFAAKCGESRIARPSVFQSCNA